jgi:hypothetical protein
VGHGTADGYYEEVRGVSTISFEWADLSSTPEDRLSRRSAQAVNAFQPPLGEARDLITRSLTPHDQNRAVSVPDDGLGDASHKGPLQGSESAAANDYQPSAQHAGQPHHLCVEEAYPRMSPRDLVAGLPDRLSLLVEFRSGLLLGGFIQSAREIGAVGLPICRSSP